MISRTNGHITLDHAPTTEEKKSILIYGANIFSFLLPLNSPQMNGAQWVKLIKESYGQSAKRDKICEVIEEIV